MSYTFSQPELRSDFIIVSSPRVFIRDYAAATLYSGEVILAVASPLSGWIDAGLISNVQIPVTRNITKLALGIPKTTRKSFEASRESQVTLTYHEMAVETIANLIGVAQHNVISMGAVVTQSTTKTIFATANEANKFVVGDYVSYWDVSGDALIGKKTVASKDLTEKSITLSSAFDVLPEAGDIVIGKAGTVATYSSSDPSVTLGAGDGAKFAVGDRVVFHPVVTDNVSELQHKTDRRHVTAVATEKLTLSSAFTGTPASPNLVVAYKSIEMLDPLGTIAEKSLLVFFDWVINSVQRQFALWYPKVTVAGSFSPDFKGGENFMDANITFEAQSTTQIMTNGSSETVLSIPFQFD